MNNQVGNAEQVAVERAIEIAMLRHLKGLDFTGATVNIFVTTASTRSKDNRVNSLYRLVSQAPIKDMMKDAVSDSINETDDLIAYKYINTLDDAKYIYVDSDITGVDQFIDSIENQVIPQIKDKGELNDKNMYILQVVLHSGEKIYAFKYISSVWSVKNTNQSYLKLDMLDGDLVADVAQNTGFRIYKSIDYLCYKSVVYIKAVTNFETSLNFHERLQAQRDLAMKSISESPLFVESKANALQQAVGKNKNFMRQLASVAAKGYYTDEEWLGKLKVAAQEAGDWLIEFDQNGAIIIKDDTEYLQELLTLLQNKRVKTIVDGEVCDVNGELIPRVAQ